MSTELAHRSTGLSLPSADALNATYKLAQTLVATDFVPAELAKGGPGAVLACILYGAELGLGPMQSLQGMYVVKGKPTMSAELMRAVVRNAGHRIEVLEKTDTRCTLRGTRADGETEELTWTIENARAAGLAGGNTWKAYPRTMLFSRATTDLCRSLFADVIKGVSYTPDEAESFGTPAGPVRVESETVHADDEPVEAEVLAADGTSRETESRDALVALLKSAERAGIDVKGYVITLKGRHGLKASESLSLLPLDAVEEELVELGAYLAEYEASNVVPDGHEVEVEIVEEDEA